MNNWIKLTCNNSALYIRKDQIVMIQEEMYHRADNKSVTGIWVSDVGLQPVDQPLEEVVKEVCGE